MNIQHEEGALAQRAKPGPQLYQRTTMPAGAPAAVVGLLHGYADHAGRYQHVADVWAEKGIGTVAVDMRGHGRAAGQRGHCQRFGDFVDDAAELTRLVRERARGAPTFLVGHSFGGLVAAATILDAPAAWSGLVLSAPFFGLTMQVPPLKVALGRLASRIVPWLALPTGLRGDMVTHDQERIRTYDQDPLGFKTATARWFSETEQAQRSVLSRAAELTLPLYVLVGGADPVAKIADGRSFFDRVGSADKTWREYDTLFHECFSEIEWQGVAEDTAAWIHERAASQKSSTPPVRELH